MVPSVIIFVWGHQAEGVLSDLNTKIGLKSQ